ncbi:MAG: glutamate--tRNA ligase [Lentisphaeria bacterium]|nr:glutamate--tRNA ligase [Lentisphaeria bacterium]
MSTNDVRVRFAPSPTGQVHIGNIRTAIFNFLFARNQGGKFILRVEDTDIERSTPEAIAKLFEVMQWLKLEVDEEPVYQTSLAGAHLEAAEKLIAKGDAYKFAKGEGGEEATLYRIPIDVESLNFVRKVGAQSVALHPDKDFIAGPEGISYALISKKGKAVPLEACLAGFQNLKLFNEDNDCIFELVPNLEAILSGERFIIDAAVRAEYDRYEVFFDDLVKGQLAKPLDSMKDLVIVRSNGTPVFHLANVCDDASQAISHIIRGDDHVENTYRHIFLFHSLGYDVPKYAHLPMIVNASGKPYSKRDGDAFVGDFKAKGYIAQALFNYLTLLGWSPGDDREKMSLNEIIKAFDITRVKSAAAQMDMNKLFNLNGQYMEEMPFTDFYSKVADELAQYDWFDSENTGYNHQVAALLQSRTKLFSQVDAWKYFYSNEYELNAKLIRKNLSRDGVISALSALAEKLSSPEYFASKELLESIVAEIGEANGFANGKLNLPIRLTVSGSNSGADLYETLLLLGAECVSSRLARAAGILEMVSAE